MQSTTQNSSNRLQRNITVYSATGIFLVSVVVALISAAPLYARLKESRKRDLQFNLKTRMLAVDQVLDRKIDIAEQITSRTRARQLLEDYYQGQASKAALVDFSTQILTEAMNRTVEIVGISRLDRHQQLLAQVGVAPPPQFWPIPVHSLDTSPVQSVIHGPIQVNDRSYLLVGAPILDPDGKQVGTDIVVFNLSALRGIIADYSGLGETGETILARFNPEQTGETVALFFPLRSTSDRSSADFTQDFIAAIATTIDQVQPGFVHTTLGKVVAFESVPHTDWAMVVQIDREELYASVNHDLGLAGVAIIGLSVLATAGVVLLLRSLTQRVIDADALEQEVQDKTAELAKEVSEKTFALEELYRTQAQLVQTEKMSSLGQLVAGIAHEINNPISFIHGNLAHFDEAMQDLLALIYLYQTQYPQENSTIDTQIQTVDLDYVQEDLPKIISSMRAGSDRVRDIVLSLRNFARLDESDLKVANIHEGIDNTLMLLQSRLNPTQTRPAIHVIKAYENIPAIECYPGQLNQVFMNLLINAIDALDETYQDPNSTCIIGVLGQQQEAEMQKQDLFCEANPFKGRTLHCDLSSVIHALEYDIMKDYAHNSDARLHVERPTIKITTEITPPNTLTIRIADNGSGIPEGALPKLFDPFFTTKPVGKGTGMGLSVCYQIITGNHNGQLYCRSDLDRGAEFVIELPVPEQITQASLTPGGVANSASVIKVSLK